MKYLISILLLGCHPFCAQEFDRSKLKEYSLDEIYSLLSSSKISNIQTCSEIGKERALFDLNSGKKQVLIHHTTVPHPCLTCAYEHIGIDELRFGTDNKFIEPVEAFRKAYNTEIESTISPDQLQLLKESNKLKPFDFNSTVTGSLAFSNRIEKQNIRISFRSDTLEHLFPTQLSQINIEFTDGITTTVCPYEELKAFGTPIFLDNRKQFSLKLVFDFRKIVAMEKLCWCSNVDQRYVFNLPILVQ